MRGQKEVKEYDLRKYLHRHEWTVDRLMDFKRAGEDLDGQEESVIRNWRKRSPCYRVAEILSELCPIEWKAELVSYEFGYIDEISKQTVEGVICFFLAGFSNTRAENDK